MVYIMQISGLWRCTKT